MRSAVSLLKFILVLCLSVLGIIFKSLSCYFSLVLICILSYEFNLAKIHRWGLIPNFVATLTNILVLQITAYLTNKMLSFHVESFDILYLLTVIGDNFSLIIYFILALAIVFGFIIAKFNNWEDESIITTKIYKIKKKGDENKIVQYFWGIIKVSQAFSQKIDAGFYISGIFFFLLFALGMLFTILSSPVLPEWHPWCSYGLEVEYTIIVAMIGLKSLFKQTQNELEIEEKYLKSIIAVSVELHKSLIIIYTVPFYCIFLLYMIRSIFEFFFLYGMFQEQYFLNVLLGDIIEFCIFVFSIVYLTIFPLIIIFKILTTQKEQNLQLPFPTYYRLIVGIFASLVTLGTNICYHYWLNEYVKNPNYFTMFFADILIEKFVAPLSLILMLSLISLFIPLLVRKKKEQISLSSRFENFLLIYVCIIPLTMFLSYTFIYVADIALKTTVAFIICFLTSLFLYVYYGISVDYLSHEEVKSRKFSLLISILFYFLGILISTLIPSLRILTIWSIILLLEDIAELIYGDAGKNKIRLLLGIRDVAS